MNIKEKKAAIAKTSAYLSAVDSDVSADNLTDKILKPKFDFLDFEDLTAADKKVMNYYANLPKYFITTDNPHTPQDKVVDIANNVLAIQNHYPDITVTDAKKDPFVQYMGQVIASNSMYDQYQDYEDLYDSFGNKDSTVYLKELEKEKENNKETHKKRQAALKSNIQALRDYAQNLERTGSHTWDAMKELLDKVSSNV